MEQELIEAYVDMVNVQNLGQEADRIPASVMQLILFEQFYQNINSI